MPPWCVEHQTTFSMCSGKVHGIQFDRHMVKNVGSLNDLPAGKRVMIRSKFVILAKDAIYEITGNRMKLKRAWTRPQLNPDGN